MMKLRQINRDQRFLSFAAVIVLSTLLILSSGCVFKKPYVGMKFDTSDWPKYSSGEKITHPTSAFMFEFTITETEEEGEYILQGTMDGTRGSVKSFNHLVIQDCRFSIVLSKDNLVVDNIIFFPIGDDHRQKLPFKRTFKTVPFDSVVVTYNVSVQG